VLRVCNMEVSVGGLKKAVEKFLLEWLTKFDADPETHHSGDHDKATESMSEWQRLCHDCAWHMKDTERAKEKKGEEKTETDEKHARLDTAGDDIIRKSLGNCEEPLPRESRAHRDRDEYAGGAEEEEARDGSEPAVDAPPQKNKRRSTKSDAEEDPVGPPVANIMHGYFGARSAAQGEDSRLKAERQMHDIGIEKARAKAMLPLEVAERQAAVDERAFALAERKAHMDQMKLMMNMLEDVQKARTPGD